MTVIVLINRHGICGSMARDFMGDTVEEILESDTGFAVQVSFLRNAYEEPRGSRKRIARIEVKGQLDFTVITNGHYQPAVLQIHKFVKFLNFSFQVGSVIYIA